MAERAKMASHDTRGKKDVPSPKPLSLRKAMGLSEPPGYGMPHDAHDYLQDNLKDGGKARGKSLRGKGAVDTKTRVAFGKKK